MKNQLICGGKVPGVPNGKIEIDLPDPSNYTYCWKRYPTDPVCTFTTQNIQGLAPDTYYLTVTDKATGCTMSKQINICCCYDNDYNPKVPGSKPHPNACKLNNSEGEALAVGANPTPPTSSSGGGSISLDISSNNPYTIKWSSNSSPIPFGAGQELGNLAPGRYCYTVTDGCAQFNDCIDLYVCDDTPIKITGTLIKPCEHSSFSTKGGISVNASDGKAPYKYVWAGGSTSPNIASLTQGTYTVKVTDKSGCTKSATFTLGLGTVTSDKITNKDCKEVFNCDGKYAHTKLLNKIWIVDPSPSACKKDEYCENNPDPIGTILGKKNYYRTNIDCRIVSEYCDLQDGSPERLIRTYTDHSNKFELDFKLCKVFETCNGISTPINSPGTSRVFHADGVKITKEWVECTEPVDCKNPKGTCGTAEFCKLKNPATKEEKEEIMPNTFKSNNAIPTGVGAKANTNCSTGKSIDIACDFTGSPVRTVCATGCLEGASEEKVIKFETIPLSSLFVKDYIRMMIEMGEANSNTDIFLPEGVDACTDLQTFNNTINSIIDTNNGVTNGYKKKAADILNSDCNSIARKTNQEDTFLVFPNPTEENVTIQCNSPAIMKY
jgi:hypothetical protein